MWTPSTRRERLGVAAAVLLAAVLALATVVLAVGAAPTVTDVQSRWGAVSETSTVVVTNVSVGGVGAVPNVTSVDNRFGAVNESTTVIHTTLVVRNPNPFPVPPVVDVGARVWLNDVVVAPADPVRTGFATGNDTVTVRTALLNERIPRWWPTHVNRGETTTVTVDPVVGVPLLGVDPPNRTRQFETDVLSAFETNASRVVRLGDRRLLRVAPLDARWGTATRNVTPLHVETTLESVHERPVTFERIEYHVSMNGVAVANGSTGRIVVSPGERQPLALDVTLDNDRLAAWWPTHVARGERTNLSVEAVGVTTVDGEPTEVPLAPLTRHVRFETDLLGGTASSIEPLPSPPGPGVAVPRLVDTAVAWSTVDEDTTRLAAEATITNPGDGDGPLADLLRLDAGFWVRANGVPLANVSVEDRPVPPGTSTLAVGEPVPGDAIERWWVTHVNRGERTRRVAHERVVADLGLTRIGLRNRTTTRTVETDALAGLGTDEPQPVTAGGQTVLIVESSTASWGTATTETTPVETSVVVRNPTPGTVTVTGVSYTVRMNEAVMANGSDPRSVAVGPGQTATLSQTLPLETERVDRWWAAHVADGQESAVTVVYTVHLRAGGETHAVTLDGMNSTITTSFGTAAG
ncbi:MAG: LEA type 2 family protein [Halobacteriaceae archaeon]